MATSRRNIHRAVQVLPDAGEAAKKACSPEGGDLSGGSTQAETTGTILPRYSRNAFQSGGLPVRVSAPSGGCS